MKTANEWGNIFFARFCAIHTGHEEFIKEIQLDAWKQGMTDASYVVLVSDNDPRTSIIEVEEKISEEIIEARDSGTAEGFELKRIPL